MRELERTFVIKHIPDLNYTKTVMIEQYYTAIKSDYEERYRMVVREDGIEFWKTIKRGTGYEREEFEERISVDEYLDNKRYAIGRVIRKARMIADTGEEVDVFISPFNSLIYLEKEFDAEEEARNYIPPIQGKDVTEDNRYSNKMLALYGLPE